MSHKSETNSSGNSASKSSSEIDDDV